MELVNGLPRHVGIIMDGNGRWAKKHGLPRNMGHKKGADAFGKVARHAARLGIEYLTVYAFSTENWTRPPEEVAGIMGLLRSYLKDAKRYKDDNIRVKIIGDLSPLDEDIRADIVRLEAESAGSSGMQLNIALSYGGRDELVDAVRAIVRKARSDSIGEDAVDRALLEAHLYTAGQPDVDLLIRTSGERRISNFLLWQSAYAEYVYTDVLWPDFGPIDLEAALEEYGTRTRRMGGL